MPATSVAPRKATAALNPSTAKIIAKKYTCQFCNRAFSRSEHRSRHERSHTKERPFKCLKCRSTFVRRDLLLRHDRTVHAKDGGIPLHSDVKRRAGAKAKQSLPLDTPTLELIEEGGMIDLETAGMLLTDMHHKAQATYGGYGGNTLESSITYPSGAISLPAWDTFMPQSSAESKAHSISSQESQMSFTSGSTIQPSSIQLPPMVGQSFHGPTYAEEPINHPIDPRKAPVTAGQSVTPQPPQVLNDGERNIILDNIRDYDKERAIPESFRLPNLQSLNRYLSTYFSLFHHHTPFLHPASVKPTDASPPLLLAILSIGALYAFEQDHAYTLHIGSKVLVSQFLQNKEDFSSRKCPLWTMQSSLLNMIFASWSGDPKGLEWASSIKSLLANMVAGNRYELKLRTEARDGAQPTRAEWVEDEGCRRTYYAVYIFFGQLTLIYNHTPAISFNEFEDLQLPSTEAMWNLDIEDDAAWRQHLSATPIVSFMDAHDNLFQGESLIYSAFATRVMMNALFLEVWYHKSSPEALQDVVTEYKLRLALETWEKSLDQCEPEVVAVPLSTPHKGHPLIFNALAMFRNARARLEVDLKSVHEALRYHDSYEVAAAMSNARDKVKRSAEMIKVIQECFNCVETAAVQGIRWVARTSATNWSIEHPLCGLDLMVILSLWLYRLENDEEPANEEELAMYNKVRSLFDNDSSIDIYDSKLSSIVARLWGSMLDEVVVWGITKMMGSSFRLHSQALVGYEDDIEALSNISTPSMIQGADDNDESLY